MSQSLWTPPESVLDRWTAEEIPDDRKIQTKIGQAERAIRRDFPTMNARLAAVDQDGFPAEPDLRESIADVVAELVQDAITNPYGLRNVTDTDGPWTQQRTIAGDNPGRMTLSAAQRRLLSPASSRSRLRSIDLEAGSHAAGGSRLRTTAAGIVVTPEGWPIP